MPSLPDQLRTDMVAAMKAKQSDRVSVLRMLMTALKETAIDKKDDLDDKEALAVLTRYAKKRRESAAEMRKIGRDDLVAKEESELAIVQEYLPAELSDQELEKVVVATIEQLGASSPKDMGRVMKAVLEKVAGRADGSRVTPLVKSRLTAS